MTTVEYEEYGPGFSEVEFRTITLVGLDPSKPRHAKAAKAALLELARVLREPAMLEAAE